MGIGESFFDLHRKQARCAYAHDVHQVCASIILKAIRLDVCYLDIFLSGPTSCRI
jgi:hypothetical protein